MMELACTLARSPRRLCEGVEPELELREGERLVRRPFNHYAPALTDWWIVPSLELPFFRFGKYFFTWDEKKRDTLQCGFGVTKGLDPMLKKVYPSKKGRRLLMEENWGWQGFYPAMMRGELAELLRTAGAGIGHKLELIFEGGYVDDPGLFNPDSELRKRDRYTLVYDPADDSIRVGGAKRDAMCLKFLNKVRDWKSFGDAMMTLNAEAFLWSDLFIANTYRIPAADGETAGEPMRTPAEIHAEWLACFRNYVRC